MKYRSFGFSRGAYTARSVVGMIRKCGLIEDTSPAAVNRAFALYRKRGARNAPDAPHIREARRRMSPGFATSQEDLDWRGDGSELVRVGFVGVWDTVGARGIPLSLFGPVASLWNRQYRFHDMQLSRLVERARHAVALDEQRLFYRPALWDNLERQGSRLGLNGGVRGAARPYQQLWFIGTHGILGGSAGNRGLSGLPLQWVVEGAPGIMGSPRGAAAGGAGRSAGGNDALAARRGALAALARGAGADGGYPSFGVDPGADPGQVSARVAAPVTEGWIRPACRRRRGSSCRRDRGAAPRAGRPSHRPAGRFPAPR